MIEWAKAIRDYVGNYIKLFQLLVTIGQVKGVKYNRKAGTNPSTSTTQREILDFYTGPTKVYNGWFEVMTQLYLIGDDIADTTQSIKVTGIKIINDDWIEAEEDFTLNGTTAVNIGTWLRVFELNVNAPHSPLVGEVFVTTGTIVPTDSDNIIAAIKRSSSGTARSNNTTKMCLYTVPSNKVVLLERLFVGSLSNKTGELDVEIRPFGGDWISLADFNVDTATQLEANYQKIDSKTDMRMLSFYENTGGKTSGSFHLYLVDKNKVVEG